MTFSPAKLVSYHHLQEAKYHFWRSVADDKNWAWDLDVTEYLQQVGGNDVDTGSEVKTNKDGEGSTTTADSKKKKKKKKKKK